MGKLGGLALLAALALSGCAAQPSAAPPSSAPSATHAEQETPLSAAPIEMSPEPVEPEKLFPTGKIGDPEVDAFFLKGIKTAWAGDMPTDQQLLDAAALACKQHEAGQDIQVVNGTTEAASNNNRNLGTYAKQLYCS